MEMWEYTGLRAEDEEEMDKPNFYSLTGTERTNGFKSFDVSWCSEVVLTKEEEGGHQDNSERENPDNGHHRRHKHGNSPTEQLQEIKYGGWDA